MRRARRILALAVLVGLLGGGVLWAAATRLGWFEHGIAHGPRDRHAVALTFDDGLNGAATLAVAALLEAHGARGTFFIVGQTIEAEAPVAQRLIERGHLLGNHSYTHPRPSRLDLRYAELSRTQTAFAQTLGRCPRYFRPPYGLHTPWITAAAQRAGMQLAGWDVTGWDWADAGPAQDAQQLAARVLREVQPGSIVLLHDGRDGAPGADRTVLLAALPAILDGLAARGLTPVTLDALLGTTGYLDRC